MAATHGKVSAFRCKLGCQSSCRVPPPARHLVVVRSTGWADPAATRAETAMFGEDFGARDPTPGEIESNFTEKTLGNYNTDHVIKIPQGMKDLLGLPTRSCAPSDQLQLLEEKELNLLKQQVPGWKVITNKAGHQAVRYEWRVKNAEAGTQLQALIAGLAQEQSHGPDLTLSGDLLVAELSSAAVQGLSMNDFIMAAKINELPVKELLTPPRKRYWA